MAVQTSNDLAHALRTLHLLDAAQLGQLPALQAQYPQPRALAGELIRRGFLTPYQINQLFLGRGSDLLLGSYVLQERLGAGGMGQVFKARNWKLGTIVALKVIHKERLGNADVLRRFRREIRASARLSHPNIVAAHDADHVGGIHFLAMEYVDGVTLAKLVEQRGPLPVAEACEYARQTALGLQHVHDKGLVHRDVKPSNLVLTTASGVPVVKVLDLGLALLREGTEEALVSTLTQEGTVMGTPDFMAPEQSTGSHTVDIRADLYSLGCTLYFLLAGQVPFPRGTLGQKIARHLSEEAVPVEALRPEVPPGIAAVVRRLLAKRPEERYPDPAALAAVLAAGGAATPSTAQVPSTATAAGPDWAAVAAPAESPSTLARRSWRKRLRVGLGLVLVLVVAGVLTWLGRRPPTAPTFDDPLAAELHALQTRLEKGTAKPETLREEVLAFWHDHPGTAAALGAARLLARLPSPLDRLQAKDIPDPQRAAAGGGDPRQAPPELVAVLGDSLFQHWSPNVPSVAWSPDGKVLATGGGDWAINLWDAKKGWLLRTLIGHRDEVTCLAWNPDSSRLASASRDGTVRVWDSATGKERHVLPGHQSWVDAVVWGPDGKQLASGGRDGMVRLWDADTGAERHALKGKNQGLVEAVAFHRDGNLLASSASDGTVRLWDPVKGTAQGSLGGKDGAVRGLVFLEDLGLLVAVCDDKPAGSILVGWDVVTRQEKTRWKTAHALLGLTRGPDGQARDRDWGARLASVSPSHEVLLWDPVLGKQVGSLYHTGIHYKASFRPDGLALATGACNGQVKLWDLERGKEELLTAYQAGPVRHLNWLEDGRWLVALGEERQVRVWDMAEGTLVRAISGSLVPLTVACPPRGKMLGLGIHKAVRLLDVVKGQETVGWPWLAGHASQLAFAPDGRTLAVSNQDAVVQLLDLPSGRVRASLEQPAGVVGMAFRGGGQQLATVHHLKAEVRLWDAQGGKPLRTFAGHNQPVQALAFRGDGGVLATASNDGTLKLWDPDSGRATRTLTGHKDQVLAVAFRPDGQVLASGGHDGSVRLWDAETGECLKVLQLGPPHGRVTQVLFTPDGRYLATGNGNGTVYLLRLPELVEAGR